MADFCKWWVYVKIDEGTQLPYIHLQGDAFFIHWELSKCHMDEEGMVHFVATHPVSPEKYPQVYMTIDSLTGLLTAYQFADERTTLQFYTLVDGRYLRVSSETRPVG